MQIGYPRRIGILFLCAANRHHRIVSGRFARDDLFEPGTPCLHRVAAGVEIEGSVVDLAGEVGRRMVQQHPDRLGRDTELAEMRRERSSQIMNRRVANPSISRFRFSARVNPPAPSGFRPRADGNSQSDGSGS